MEVAAHVPLSREEKLQAVQKELMENEASTLRRFKDARKKGEGASACCRTCGCTPLRLPCTCSTPPAMLRPPSSTN